MRDTALRQRHPAGTVSDDNSVLRSRDLFIVERDTLHQPDGVDALLKTHTPQVVEGEPGKSDDGRAIESRFVKAIHQMDRPGTCRPNAHAEAAAGNGTAEPGGPQAPQPGAPSARGAQGSAGGDAHPHAEVILAGDVTLDVGRLVADIGNGPVPLTRLEFLLLRELAEHVGQSVPKGTLLATVWGYDFDPGSNVVDVCVRRLRSKLGFDLIKTVRGEGYQLVAR